MSIKCNLHIEFYILYKKRNELVFRVAQVKIEGLKKRALEGEMVLAYMDEVGFAKVHPNRGVWIPKGARHLIEAVRDLTDISFNRQSKREYLN
jgi:hypothetical protein